MAQAWKYTLAEEIPACVKSGEGAAPYFVLKISLTIARKTGHDMDPEELLLPDTIIIVGIQEEPCGTRKRCINVEAISR